MALGAGLLVLILLVLGVRGCVNARQDRAMKDYVRNVSDLTSESKQQSKAFFGLLNGPGGRNQPVEVQNSLNGFRVQSAQLVDRASALSHPGEAGSAHDALVETLEFRRNGLAAIADALPTALGDQNRREGTDKVTQQMQSLLASDVAYTQRFVPGLRKALRDDKLLAEVRIPASQFVPNVQWLQPSFVAQKVGALRSGKNGAAASPGLHGTGLGTVSLGGQALTPGGSVSIKLSNQLKADIQVANQGQNTETDVNVKVTIGKGADAINAEQPLATIAAGETKTVTLTIGEQPPTGQNVPVTVDIAPVPGEKKTDNNKQTYTVIFTR
jgi:hypothetical protein